MGASSLSDLPCDSSSLQWGSLIITFISTNITWWIFDVPTIWQQHWQVFLNSVAWQALRVFFPGVTGVYALVHARDPHDVAKVYYLSVKSTEQPMTTFQSAKVITSDIITLTGTIISIVNACNIPTDERGDYNEGQWNVAGQMLSALPAAIIGLYLLTLPLMGLRNTWGTLLGGFVCLAVPSVVFTLVLYYKSPLVEDGSWFLPTICYIYMALPLPIIFNNFWFILMCAALAFLSRNGMVGISALSHSQRAPFCGRDQKTFGGIYLAFGIIGGIFALWGYFHFGLKNELYFDWRWARNWRLQNGRSTPALGAEANVVQGEESARHQKQTPSQAARHTVMMQETITYRPDTSRCNHWPNITKTCGRDRTPFRQKLHNLQNTPICILLGGEWKDTWPLPPQTITKKRYRLGNADLDCVSASQPLQTKPISETQTPRFDSYRMQTTLENQSSLA